MFCGLKKQRKVKAEEQKRIAAERATWGKWSYTEFTDDASGKKGKRATLLRKILWSFHFLIQGHSTEPLNTKSS